MKTISLTLAFLSVIAFAETSSTVSIDDPMQAHEFRKSGPWFEGWYTRITDKRSGVSIAVITTSAIHKDETLAAGEQPSGYIAVAVKTPTLGKTKSYEAFPKSTSLTNHNADFLWQAQGYGRASKAWTDVAIPGAHVQVKIKSRKSWSNDGSGPEGVMADLPFMPLHWFVHNTVGEADYALDYEVGGVTHHIEGSGFVHQEKNWGLAFPTSWMWSQAVSDDGSAYLALAGGDLGVGPLTAHSYMLGYRSGGRVIDFRIGQGLSDSFVDEVDGCARKFSLEANNDFYMLKLIASADPQSFASLSIPTSEGYEPNGAIESFSATIEVKLFKKGGFLYAPTYSLVETRVLRQAALEFGAAAMKCAAH